MASAKPIAVVRFSAKIDTSVNRVMTRSTAREPRIAITPTATGNAAANSPPNTQTSTRKLERHHEHLGGHQVAFRLLGDLQIHHGGPTGPDDDSVPVMCHLGDQRLG